MVSFSGETIRQAPDGPAASSTDASRTWEAAIPEWRRRRSLPRAAEERFDKRDANVSFEISNQIPAVPQKNDQENHQNANGKLLVRFGLIR